jgi:hypothetical protein
MLIWANLSRSVASSMLEEPPARSGGIKRSIIINQLDRDEGTDVPSGHDYTLQFSDGIVPMQVRHQIPWIPTGPVLVVVPVRYRWIHQLIMSHLPLLSSIIRIIVTPHLDLYLLDPLIVEEFRGLLPATLYQVIVDPLEFRNQLMNEYRRVCRRIMIALQASALNWMHPAGNAKCRICGWTPRVNFAHICDGSLCLPDYQC